MKNGIKARRGEGLPLVISVRTKAHERQLLDWRRTNKRVPWGCLLRDALEHYFKKEAA